MKPLALIFLLLANPAFAQKIPEKDCTTIDASTHMGPVRDQGSAEWCFAFSGADVLTQHLKLDPSKRISAFDMALQLYKHEPKDVAEAFDKVWNKKISPDVSESRQLWKEFYEGVGTQTLENRPTDILKLAGGWPDVAILLYNKTGLCTENNFPSEQSILLKSQKDYILNTLYFSQLYFLNIKKAQQAKDPACLPFLAPQAQTLHSLTALTEVLEKENKKNVLSSLQNTCKERITSNTPILPISFFDTPTNNMLLVNENLSAHIPTIINYDAQKLFGKDARVKKSTPNHASTIVGRRWNRATKTCEFKLRNSWGPSWCPSSHYPAKRCEDGNVWLTPNELAPFIVSTTHIVQ